MMPIAVVVRKRADDLRHHIRADGLIEDSGESAVGPHAELPGKAPRSEEHTSELQSRPHIVCRLLLEKKNQLGAGEGGRVEQTVRRSFADVQRADRGARRTYVVQVDDLGSEIRERLQRVTEGANMTSH